MKTKQKILALLFVLSQVGLWLWWRNRNFDLAMDLVKLGNQQQELQALVNRQENQLAAVTSLRELTRAGRQLEISLVKHFWQIPEETIAWRP